MLKSKFNNKSDGKVYHCIPVSPEGEVIRPSIGYGNPMSARIRQLLNIDTTEKVPVVFAALRMSKALAFGFQYHSGEILLNASMEEADVELAVICNRKETMARDRDITVYEISDKNFVKLDAAADQAVSKEAVKFSDAKIVFKAKSAHDLMTKGLQVISYEGHALEIQKEFYDLIDKRGLYTAISEFLKSGKLIWENKESNLNADPTLAKLLNVPLEKSKNLQVKKHFAK